MNNCPKCGNPLQVGVNTCPICGTNVGVVSTGGSTVAPVKQTVQVAQVSEAPKVQTVAQQAPVTNQPVTNNAQTIGGPQSNPTPNNKVVSSVANPSQPINPQQVQSANGLTGQASLTTSPVAPQVPTQTSTSTNNQQNLSSNLQNNQNVAQPVMSVANTPQVSVQPVVQPAQEQGQVVPTVSSSPVVPISVTPTNDSVAVPGIPASLTNGSVQNLEVNNIDNSKKDNNKNKDKKSTNKKPLVFVGVFVLLMIVAVSGYVMFGSGKKLKGITPEEESELQTSLVISHGFKFGLEDGWLINEDQNNIIITNSAETVSIRLSQSPTSITNITEDIINEQLSRNKNFSNAEVGTIQIGARDAFVVNALLNETLPVQIYFVSGGSSLTLGVTIIYQSAETKTKLESNILELVGSISYSDDSIKAISTISMYSEAFNIFNNVVTNKQPEEPELPVEDDLNDQEEAEETNPEEPNSVNQENQNAENSAVETPEGEE